jgi:hypothetical protein
MDNFEINRLGSQINMLRDVSSAVSASRYFDAVDDINRGMREKAERERKAAEATIELNEQTKIQNQLLREQNQRLNETIMQLKDQHGNKSLPSTANASYQFDVFVSHANDNKEEFVNALTAELSRLGISIWYDANILDWGDNWKLQIANGLKKCRFGIVVVSPEFLGREWTEKELNELLQRQNEAGEKVILPLLYKLTISDMKKQYPQLADFQARIIAPDDDVRDIVIDFARILIRALKG